MSEFRDLRRIGQRAQN